MMEALLWAGKVLGGALVVSVALGMVIVAVGVAREAVWSMRQENRKKSEQEEEK